MSGTAILSGRDLSRSFGTTQALRGADIDVVRGEIVAIVGPSGSGKSTLLHCLAGILRPSSGEVWYDGTRLDTLDERTRTRLRREHFGFVFQFGQLVPELAAVENVALPLVLSGMKRREAVERAATWFGPLRLDGLERRQLGQLSGGEAQRVALARALVTQPTVVFADEPTGSLDSLSGEIVMDLLVGMAEATATTVVLVTHEARIAAFAYREVTVCDGRIVVAVES